MSVTVALPPPHEPFVDLETGKISTVWYNYLSQFAAWFHYLSLSPTLTPGNPDVATYPSIDISGITTLSIANGGNAIVKGSGIVVVQEATQGDMAMYFITPAGVVRNVAMGFGNWVNSTAAPLAGQLSVAWDGASNFRVYNNQGATETVTYFLIGI